MVTLFPVLVMLVIALLVQRKSHKEHFRSPAFFFEEIKD